MRASSNDVGLGQALANELKAFNAKERDHLMRLAYLGATEDYAHSDVFLSASMEHALKPHAESLGVKPPRCVFAGMDFHIDWIHAAMVSPIEGVEAAPADASVMARIDSEQARWSDFRPVTGTHEDVDLLVAFADDSKVALLFVEAKGESSFGRPQLARKILRLDRIAALARQRFGADRVAFRLLLAAPELPAFCDEIRGTPALYSCIAHLNSESRRSVGYEKMRQTIGASPHQAGLGASVGFLPLSNYPKNLDTVIRVGKADGHFTAWERRKRRRAEVEDR